MSKKKKYSNCLYGIYGIKFLSLGNTSDPLICWRGYYFNYYDIESALYSEYCENNEEISSNDYNAFYEYYFKNSAHVKNYLKDCIFGGYKFKTIEKLIASY